MHLLKLAHPCVEMSVGVMSDLVGRVGKFKQVFARGFCLAAAIGRDHSIFFLAAVFSANLCC